jgi:ubiquinone/menaquinone biosynthesis C-methylase UbiE
VEPADVGWRLAAERLRASSIPVERSGLDGQSLPFDDDSFDTALSTWTMCSIPDIERALAEVRRVLKPGGTLCFVEHGLAPDERGAPLAASPRAVAEAALRRLSLDTRDP